MTTITTESIKSILTFPFEDEKWKTKLLLGTLLSFAGVVIFPYWYVLGYFYEIMRQIIVDRESPSLPEWDNWEQLLKNGFRIFGVSFIYSFPSLLFIVVPQIAMLFVAPMSESGGPEEAYFSLVSMPILMGSMGIGMTLALISTFFMTVAVGHMVAKDEFAAAFRVKEWWPILRKNIVGYILSIVLVTGVYWLVSFASQLLILTIVLCVVYPLALTFATIYVCIIGAVLFAQAYVEGVQDL